MYSRICIVICNYNFTLSKNSKSCCTVISLPFTCSHRMQSTENSYEVISKGVQEQNKSVYEFLYLMSFCIYFLGTDH